MDRISPGSANSWKSSFLHPSEEMKKDLFNSCSQGYSTNRLLTDLACRDVEMVQSEISKVLIIYTVFDSSYFSGWDYRLVFACFLRKGMQNIDGKGYMPVADYLPTLLSEMTMFHDAKSLEGRLEFNSVNQALRYPFEVDIEDANDLRPMSGTINGTPYTRIQRPSLVTPRSLYGKVTKYSILEYNPLLDSSNMTMEDWIKIAVDIELNYELFDSFVVLHGTDTMCYTSSALSFMLEDLGKTVIVRPLPLIFLDNWFSDSNGRG
jgi:hypothetical protein